MYNVIQPSRITPPDKISFNYKRPPSLSNMIGRPWIFCLFSIPSPLTSILVYRPVPRTVYFVWFSSIQYKLCSYPVILNHSVFSQHSKILPATPTSCISKLTYVKLSCATKNHSAPSCRIWLSLSNRKHEDSRRYKNISGVQLGFSIRRPVPSSTWMNSASHREDIPNNYHLKVFFQLVCVSRKIEICEGKMEKDVKLWRPVQWIGDSLSRWTSRGSA
jgi:hypothetical protein